MDYEVMERIDDNNHLINQYLLKNNIDPIDYNWDMYFEAFIKKKNVAFITNPPRLSIDFYSGFTVKSNYSTAIFINPNMAKVRKRFSAAHESEHIQYDFDDDIPSQKFFNVEENTAFYTTEELRLETLANAGAGVKMIPDITIVKLLEKDISFYRMAENLGVSSAALYTRLVQFCQGTINLPYNSAASLVRDFQLDKSRKYFINQYLSGWGSTRKKEIEYRYLNSL